jgi:hypothetical protein
VRLERPVGIHAVETEPALDHGVAGPERTLGLDRIRPGTPSGSLGWIATMHSSYDLCRRNVGAGDLGFGAAHGEDGHDH